MGATSSTMHVRYRVRPGCTFLIHGHIAGRGGEFVDVDMSLDGSAELVESQSEKLEAIGPVQDEREGRYKNREMRGSDR